MNSLKYSSVESWIYFPLLGIIVLASVLAEHGNGLGKNNEFYD